MRMRACLLGRPQVLDVGGTQETQQEINPTPRDRPPPPPTLVRATVAASAGGGYPPCSNGLSVEDAGAGGGALAVDTRTLSEVSIDLSIDQSRIS